MAIHNQTKELLVPATSAVPKLGLSIVSFEFRTVAPLAVAATTLPAWLPIAAGAAVGGTFYLGLKALLENGERFKKPALSEGCFRENPKKLSPPELDQHTHSSRPLISASPSRKIDTGGEFPPGKVLPPMPTTDDPFYQQKNLAWRIIERKNKEPSRTGAKIVSSSEVGPLKDSSGSPIDAPPSDSAISKNESSRWIGEHLDAKLRSIGKRISVRSDWSVEEIADNLGLSEEELKNLRQGKGYSEELKNRVKLHIRKVAPMSDVPAKDLNFLHNAPVKPKEAPVEKAAWLKSDISSPNPLERMLGTICQRLIDVGALSPDISRPTYCNQLFLSYKSPIIAGKTVTTSFFPHFQIGLKNLVGRGYSAVEEIKPELLNIAKEMQAISDANRNEGKKPSSLKLSDELAESLNPFPKIKTEVTVLLVRCTGANVAQSTKNESFVALESSPAIAALPSAIREPLLNELRKNLRIEENRALDLSRVKLALYRYRELLKLGETSETSTSLPKQLKLSWLNKTKPLPEEIKFGIESTYIGESIEQPVAQPVTEFLLTQMRLLPESVHPAFRRAFNLDDPAFHNQSVSTTSPSKNEDVPKPNSAKFERAKQLIQFLTTKAPGFERGGDVLRSTSTYLGIQPPELQRILEVASDDDLGLLRSKISTKFREHGRSVGPTPLPPFLQ
jgi:hypothetical protein